MAVVKNQLRAEISHNPQLSGFLSLAESLFSLKHFKHMLENNTFRVATVCSLLKVLSSKSCPDLPTQLGYLIQYKSSSPSQLFGCLLNERAIEISSSFMDSTELLAGPKITNMQHPIYGLAINWKEIDMLSSVKVIEVCTHLRGHCI